MKISAGVFQVLRSKGPHGSSKEQQIFLLPEVGKNKTPL